MRFSGRICNIAALAIVLGAGTARAALISISSASLSANGAQLTLNAGEIVVFAWNANGNAASDPVVNGITFSNTLAGATVGGFPALVADDTVTSVHYSGSMPEIMGDLMGTNTNSSGTFTVNSLTPGATYRMQFLSHQDVNNDAIRQMEVFYGTTSGTSSGTFAMGNEIGRITTVNFIADSTSQLFTLRSGTDDRAILNGVVLVQVPEPGSALLALGLGGMLLCRRRRRA